MNSLSMSNNEMLADDRESTTSNKQIPEMSTVSSYSEICDDSVSGIISTFDSHSETDEDYVDAFTSPLRSKTSVERTTTEATDSHFVPEYGNDESDQMTSDITSVVDTTIRGKRKRTPTQFLLNKTSQLTIEPLAAQAQTSTTTSSSNTRKRKRAKDNLQPEKTTFDGATNSWKRRKRDVNPSDTKGKGENTATATEIINRGKTKGRASPSSKSVTFDTNDVLTHSNNKQNSRWEANFRLLLEYKRKFQSTRVPQNSVEYKTLAAWANYQRQRYSQGKVNDERVELLESIGFEWDPGKKEWMKKYERLVAYKQSHGTTFVPQEYKKDPQLKSWVNNQRHRCKMQYRIELLNAIDFIWKV